MFYNSKIYEMQCFFKFLTLHYLVSTVHASQPFLLYSYQHLTKPHCSLRYNILSIWSIQLHWCPIHNHPHTINNAHLKLNICWKSNIANMRWTKVCPQPNIRNHYQPQKLHQFVYLFSKCIIDVLSIVRYGWFYLCRRISVEIITI